MVKSWYLEDSKNSLNFENEDVSNEKLQYLDNDELEKVSGVLLFKIDVDSLHDEKLARIKFTRGYNYVDEVELTKEKIPDLEERLAGFFREHQHNEEEIRLILEGGGYFDVRDKSDRWIRVHTRKGDLIILPSGIYHRFKMDEQKYTKYKRMFISSPIWKATNRDEVLIQ